MRLYTVDPRFCHVKWRSKIKWQDRIMTKPNIWSYHFDHIRKKSGNKNFDDNFKLWQDQGWQNRGMTVTIIWIDWKSIQKTKIFKWKISFLIRCWSLKIRSTPILKNNDKILQYIESIKILDFWDQCFDHLLKNLICLLKSAFDHYLTSACLKRDNRRKWWWKWCDLAKQPKLLF